MTPTRREFIQSLGVALASLVLTRCKPSSEEPVVKAVIVETSCYIIVTDEVEVPRATLTVGEKAQRRQQVRDCWLRLDWLAERAQAGAEEASLAKQELTAKHRTAVNDLVTSGEMSGGVAACIKRVYAAAVDHVVQSSVSERTLNELVDVEENETPPPTPQVDEMARRIVMDSASGTGGRLVQQADLLSEMAGTSDIDPETVDLAQSAIQRDMMLLSVADRRYIVTQLVEAAGGTYDFPPIEDLEVEIPPEVAEAARFLVELLLEE